MDEKTKLSEISERETQLQQRLERLKELESEILSREKEIKARESTKKSVLLRLPPTLHTKICEWAEEDFRSVNSQIEYLLTRAVSEKYKDK